MSKLIQYFKGSQIQEVLKHSRNYFIGDVGTKAIGVISLPVFTRLMDRNDYGIVSIFVASTLLLNTISTLNLSDGISRYFFEKNKNDFANFLSSTIQFTWIIQLPIIAMLFFWQDVMFDSMGIPGDLFIFLIIALVFLNVQKIFRATLVTKKKSKHFAIYNTVKGYSSFALSWLFLVFGQTTAYLLRLTGISIVQFIATIYMAMKVNSQVVWGKIRWSHISYGLKFSLPRLPFVLSGTILGHFDRIMIGGFINSGETALYSVAYNVGSLSLLVIGAISPALLPNFYELMNEGKYDEVDRLNVQFTWIIVFSGIGLMLLGQPILYLLADTEYHGGGYIIPIIVIGYMFFALTGVFNRFVGYYKVTILQSIGAVFAGAANIGLNLIFIPKYGIVAAAYTTAISFLVQSLVTWLLVKTYSKGHITPIVRLIPPLLVAVFAFIIVLKFLWI